MSTIEDSERAGAAIRAVATALPANYVEQAELTAALRELWVRADRDVRLFDRIQRSVKVAGRHLCLPLDAYRELNSFAACNDAYIRIAPELGAQALSGALQRAGLKARDVDHLFFVTVTGIATPSIDTRVIGALGLRPQVKRTPIFGLGCVAGAAATARAADYVRAFPSEVAAVLSVELCSLTLQKDDLSIANIVASGLFGDGAAAAVVTGAQGEARPRIIGTRSILYPDTERILGWDMVDSGFKIVLSARLTELVRAGLRAEVDALLAAHRVDLPQIAHWIVHAGGPKVLDAVARALELSEGALARSWRSLSSTGNLSSASVLFILDELIADGGARPGDYGMMIAMGPGFSVELILLRW